MMMKSGPMPGGASPGAVKITLRTANDGVDEKAEVTVALNNPEEAVAKMLSTLAQRFPPESVMTIAPTRGLDSSEASSDVSGSRYASSDVQPGVYLPPNLRDAMSNLPVEITSWILAADPNILPELLHLASRGGDAKVWAQQNGLAPEPVELVVNHMARDPELYDWVDKLAQASLRPKSSAPKHRKPKHRGNSRTRRDASAYQRLPVHSRDPSRDILLINPETGKVEGFESPSDPTRPVWLPTGPVSMTGVRPSPAIPGAAIVPRDPRVPGTYWVVDPDGNIIGHVDRAGRSVLYPSSQRPQLSDPYARASSIPGLTAVPVNPVRPQAGNWLLDPTGRVVGHTVGGATVRHPPGGRVSRPVDAPAGVIAVPYRPDQPEAGSWLVDDEGNIVGHVGPDGIPVTHPHFDSMGMGGGISPIHPTYGFPGFPAGSGLYGAGGSPSSPHANYPQQQQVFMPPTPMIPVPDNLRQVPINKERPQNGSWLVDPATGKTVGYTLSNGQAMMFPKNLPRTDGQRPSGFPGLDVVPADASRPALGGPWITNEMGEVVGHYDSATGKPVMHPPTGASVDSVLPGLKAIPMNSLRPNEGTWLINSEGQIVGHTDERGHPILYPQGGYPRGAGSPSGVPGVNIVPRDPAKPQDGGPWLVDEDGIIVGHYDSRGRPVLHPADLAPIVEGGDKGAVVPPSSRPSLIDIPRSSDDCWLYDSRGNLVGHTAPTGEVIAHPTQKFSPGYGKPSGIPGLSVVSGPTAWLIDSDGKVVGHHDSYGRVVMHPVAAPAAPAVSDPSPAAHFGTSPQHAYGHQSFGGSPTAGQKTPPIPVDPSRPEDGFYICSSDGEVIGHTNPDGSVVMHPTRPYPPQRGRPSRVPKLNEITETKGPHQGTWLINPQSGEIVGHVDPSGRPVMHPPKAAARVPMDHDNQRAGEWLYDADGKLIGHTTADGRMVAHPTQPFGRNAGTRSPVPGLNQVTSSDPEQGIWLTDPQTGEVVGHLDEAGRPVMHPPSAVSRKPINARHPSRGDWLTSADGLVVAHTNPDGSLVVHPHTPMSDRGRPSHAVPNLNEVSGFDNATWLVNPQTGDIAGFVDASGKPILQPAKGAEVPIDPRSPEDGCWILDPSGQIIGHTTPNGRTILHPAGHVSSRQTSPTGLPGIRTMQPKEHGDPTWLVDSHGYAIGHITHEGRVVVFPQHQAPRSGTAPINPKRPQDGSFLFDADGNVVGHTDQNGAMIMHPSDRFTLSEMQPVMRGVNRVPGRKPNDPTWLADDDGEVIGHIDPRSGNAVLYPQKGSRKLGTRRGTSFSSASYRMYDPQNMASNMLGGKSTWLTDPEGNVIGHLDANGNAVIHPTALHTAHSRPQGGFIGSPVTSDPARGSLVTGSGRQGGMAFQFNEQDPWLRDAAGQVVGHYRPDGAVVLHPKPFGPGAGSPSRTAPGFREVQSPRPDDPIWLVDANTGEPVGFIDREMGTPRFFTSRPRGDSQGSSPKLSPGKPMPSPVPGLDARPINPYRPGEGSWLIDPEGYIVGHTDAQNRPVLHPAVPLSLGDRTPSGIPGIYRVPRDRNHPENGGPWLVDAEGHVVGHFDPEGRPVLQPADAPKQSAFPHRQSAQYDPPKRPMEPHMGGGSQRYPSGSGNGQRLDSPPYGRVVPLNPADQQGPAWILDRSTQRPIAYLERAGAPPLYYPSGPFPPNSGTPTEVPGLRIMQRDPAHPERGGPWLVDEDGNLIGHFGSDTKPILFPGAAENLANLRRLPSSRAQPGYREMPVDPNRPEHGNYIIDPQTGEAIGHALPNGTVVRYPSGPLSLSQAQPTGIAGVNRLPLDFSNPFRQIPLIVDDQGNVIGHFAPNGRAYMHPAPVGRRRRASNAPGALGAPDASGGVKPMPFESPVPGLGAIPRSDNEGGAWLISPENKIVGHTDAMNRPVMHPQQQFAPGSGEAPTGIPGINVLPRDPSRPDLGGPWLVDNDGNVIGHFAPDGTPILHKGSAYNLKLSSPSNIPGLRWVPVEPKNPNAGKWLYDPIKDQIVGFVDGSGRSVMFPKEMLRSYQRYPELPGINLAPLNPSRPDLGGPWIVDDRGRVIAFYSPDGSLRLMPVGEQPEIPGLGAGHMSDIGPDEQVVYEPDGTRVRYVEVAVEQEVVKEIPVKEVREIEKKVAKQIVKEIEKIEEVEEIQWVDKIVEIEQIEEVVKRVPRKEIVEVPREHVTYVPKEEVRIVEKIVEIPEMIEVPKPYTVENRVNVPRYINKETHTMVAQRLRPIIREAGQAQKIEAKTYEPVLYPVDVFVPMPVKSSFIPMGKVDEIHNTVEVPAPQYNSLLKKMNQHLPPEATQDLQVRGVGGSIPLLPVGELVEIVPPVPSAFAQHAVKYSRRDKTTRQKESAKRHHQSKSAKRSSSRTKHHSSRK